MDLSQVEHLSSVNDQLLRLLQSSLRFENSLELDWRCPRLVQTEGDCQHREQGSGKSGRDLELLDNAEEADFEPCPVLALHPCI